MHMHNYIDIVEMLIVIKFIMEAQLVWFFASTHTWAQEIKWPLMMTTMKAPLIVKSRNQMTFDDDNNESTFNC